MRVFSPISIGAPGCGRFRGMNWRSTDTQNHARLEAIQPCTVHHAAASDFKVSKPTPGPHSAWATALAASVLLALAAPLWAQDCCSTEPVSPALRLSPRIRYDRLPEAAPTPSTTARSTPFWPSPWCWRQTLCRRSHASWRVRMAACCSAAATASTPWAQRAHPCLTTRAASHRFFRFCARQQP